MSQTSFLHQAATQIWQRHSGNLEEVLVLTPNRRTMLFFKKALAEVAGRPVWAPECYTLDAWIKNQVQLELPDELVLVMHLHRCWTEAGHQDSFERFYSLGQQIIRDFNAIDEALVDTRRLFRDLAAIPAMDEDMLADIEPGLAELALRIRKSEAAFRIGEIWQHLGDVYDRFNAALMHSRLAYPGMLYRHFAERETTGQPKSYPAAYGLGFYKWNEADKKILGRIPDIVMLTPEFPESWHADLQWEPGKVRHTTGWQGLTTAQAGAGREIEIFGVSGRQQQLQGLAAILEEKTQDELSETMVLLPEQAILLPLLQSIPEKVDELNVSMGLSVLDTRVYTLVESYLRSLDAWSASGEYIASQALVHFLRQPLLQPFLQIDPSLMKETRDSLYLKKESIWHLLPIVWQGLLKPVKQTEVLERCLELLRIVNEQAEDELDKAAIHPLYVRLQKLDRVMQNEVEHDWSPAFFSRFLRRILQHTRITLSGEPLRGLQVLGLPESANLSFKHLIVLDANEGVLPMVRHQSLIPYSLLKAYGIPGMAEQAAVQEHLFWAACSTAARASIFYNTEAVNGTATEPSRWIQRLLMKLHPDSWTITPRSLQVASDNLQAVALRIPSDETVRGHILRWVQNKPISASALNTWLTCRLKWYLHHVLDFREKQTLNEDPAADKVGTIVHGALQSLLERHLGHVLSPELIQTLHSGIPGAVKEAYLKEIRLPEYRYHQTPHRLYAAAIETMTAQLLEFDALNTGAVVESLEGKWTQDFMVGERKITLTGIVDRMDHLEDVVRIVDYKTGKVAGKKSHELDVNKTWERDGKNNKEALQVLYYTLLYHLKHPERPLPEMHLFFSRKVKDKEKTRVELTGQANAMEALERFEAELKEQIEAMLSPDLLIDQTEATKNCSYCPYASMCGRY